MLDMENMVWLSLHHYFWLVEGRWRNFCCYKITSGGTKERGHWRMYYMYQRNIGVLYVPERHWCTTCTTEVVYGGTKETRHALAYHMYQRYDIAKLSLQLPLAE